MKLVSDEVTLCAFNAGFSKVIKKSNVLCRNPSLELATKARACKVTSQEGSPGVSFHVLGSAKECEGMNPFTPK